MGKSTTSQIFVRRGIPVLDSDTVSARPPPLKLAKIYSHHCVNPRHWWPQVVHQLYARGGAAVPLVAAAFPGVVVDEAVDRGLLSRRVIGAPEALRALEAVVHPLVQAAKRRFVADAAECAHALVVLDVPLLFETGAEAGCDAVAVVSAPGEVQRARVLARPGMTAEKLEGILARQMPDEEKRRRADFVIHTGGSVSEAEVAVEEVLAALRGRRGAAAATLLAGGG
jgi:dephospho-CoA kinase